MLYKIYYLSVLTYGVETWAWAKRDISRLHEVPLQHYKINKKG
jgi:hypothetical protein